MGDRPYVHSLVVDRTEPRANADFAAQLLGGRAVQSEDPPAPGDDRGFRVYADPAGHTFCLCRPSPTSWD